MEMKYVDSKDIENFFWSALVKLGYAPCDDEVMDLADICFDFLLDIGVLEEVDDS